MEHAAAAAIPAKPAETGSRMSPERTVSAWGAETKIPRKASTERIGRLSATLMPAARGTRGMRNALRKIASTAVHSAITTRGYVRRSNDTSRAVPALTAHSSSLPSFGHHRHSIGAVPLVPVPKSLSPIGETWIRLPSPARVSPHGAVADRWKHKAATASSSNATPSKMRLRRGFPGRGLNSTRLHVDGNVGDRDRDRAKQRSTFLEAFNQSRRGRAVGAGNGEVEADRVEQRHIGPCLTRAIHHAVNGDARWTNLDVRVASDDLHELHPTRRDGGQEEFRRRQLFAGTAVLHRTIDDEVVRSRVAEYTTKDIGRSCRDVVFA